jgi:hypothetical protein
MARFHVMARCGQAFPWRTRLRNFDGFWFPNYFNPSTVELSTGDPRLGPLPSEWEQIPRSKETADDLEFLVRFKNERTGAVMNSDPRMLPEALEQRGVELQTFRLI